MLGLDPTTGKLKVYGNEVNKQIEDPRKHIQPIIYTEQKTKTSLLKHLDDELKDLDYSAYEQIDKNLIKKPQC